MRVETETVARNEGGALKKYMARAVGSDKISTLIGYELATLFFSNFPGAAGIILRKLFFRQLLGEFGAGVVLSRGVTLRCPGRLFLGEGTLIDEGVFFDIKSADATVRLGGRNQIMHGVHFETGYHGSVTVGDDSFIGAYTILNGQGGIEIGKNALIAGHCHIVAANHVYEDPERPINDQGFILKGIRIEDDVWLGAGVKVLDGVTIGKGSVCAAGAVVHRNVPPNTVVGGVPAKPIGTRPPGRDRE